MTNYELMLILDPMLADDVKEQTVETVKSIIETEGKVGEIDTWA